MEEKRVVLKRHGIVDPLSIDDYLSKGGYEGLKKVLSLSSDEVLSEVGQSGLRGRGGASYPVALKWKVCSASDERKRCLVCNGVESDPHARGNKVLLTGDPHSVIEGMIIAAFAIGAHRGYLYCSRGETEALKILENGLTQARENNYLGDAILNTNFNFDIEIVKGEGDFICGEETVLIASMEGVRRVARVKPPYPAQAGLHGKPTVVHNPETLANLPVIMRSGAKGFREMGVSHDPGTKVLTLSNESGAHQVMEVEIGTPFREIVFEGGKEIFKGKSFKALKLGGPTGGFLPEKLLDTPLDFDSLAKEGQIMGSGSIKLVTEGSSIVEKAREYISFSVDASCGLCVPCRFGLKVLQNLLEKFLKGEAVEEDITTLEEMSRHISDTSLCGLGKTAPNPVLSSIKYFQSEYSALIKDRSVALTA